MIHTMRYFVIGIYLLMGAHYGSFAQKMKKYKIEDSGMTLKVPALMFPMSESDQALKYPSVRKPIAAFTDENRVIDFGIHIGASQWADTDKELAMLFFKASVLELFDQVDMSYEGIREINGKEFIGFEFISHMRGTQNMPPERMYNYLMYYLYHKKTPVFLFRCPYRDMEVWKPAGKKMIESVKIKKAPK